jgi:hypothetical protein
MVQRDVSSLRREAAQQIHCLQATQSLFAGPGISAFIGGFLLWIAATQS